MMQPALVVVKVGGSLLDWPELPGRLTAYLNARRALDSLERIVLIAGGGLAADWIRALDRIHGLGEQSADALARHALDLTAVVLAGVIPESIACDRLEMLKDAWDSGSIPILAPRSVLLEIDRTGEYRLPASWDVTSDAIAASITAFLGAGSLVLVKSAPLPPGATRRVAARLGLVDPMFPKVAGSIPRVEYVNLRGDPLERRPLPP